MSFCSICLDGYEEDVNKIVVVINCSHVFHGECIEKWYQQNLIPAQYNEKELPDLLHCPICNVHHKNAEFRQIFLSVDNAEPRRLPVGTMHQKEGHLANLGNNVEVVDVEAEATTRELKEKVLQLETKVKKLKRTVQSKDVALSRLYEQDHQRSAKRVRITRMSSRYTSNSGNNSPVEGFLRAGKSSYRLRTRKSR